MKSETQSVFTNSSSDEINAFIQDEYITLDVDESFDTETLPGEPSIWDELDKENHKRKLGNLKRFLINEDIIRYSVKRCLSRASKSKERDFYKQPEETEKLVARIKHEMETETYEPEAPIERLIKKKGKGDKDRLAHIYSIFDRCVQNLIYVIIEKKFRNKMLDCVYSRS